MPELSENIWFGITTENQSTADERLPVLSEIPAAVKFVSCEPLLGDIDLRLWIKHIDWVICGAETGPGARCMSMQRAIKLFTTVSDINSIPFFWKQGTPGIDYPHFLKVREFPS